MLCRDVQKATDVASEIVELSQRGCVQVYHLDLSSFASVKKCANQIQINEFRLDYLGSVHIFNFFVKSISRKKFVKNLIARKNYI